MKIILLTITSVLLLLISSCSDDSVKKDESVENKPTKEVDLDFSKDEDVIKLMKKEWNAENLSDDDICIERPASFDKLVIIGSFAHDRGCAGDDIIYNDKLTNADAASKQILADNGWSDRRNRGKLAVSYTIDVLHVWESVLTSSHDNFVSDEYKFAAPASAMEDGEVTVTCWVKEPSGMSPEDSFYHLTVVFGDDGSIKSYEKTNQFTVSID